MIKNILKKVSVVVVILVAVYLILPGPAEPPPLPDSRKSTEPGDTGQIPGLFAYYTNLSRAEATNFYLKYYSRSKLLGIPLLTIRLNHPPEYAWEVIINTIHTSYLEEFVHPLRESLFINGYEPANDPFREPGQKLANFEFDGKEYSMKVMVYKRDSHPIARLVVFVVALWCLKILFSLAGSLYENFGHHRQL